MQVVSRRESEARAPWLHSLTAAQEEDHEDHTDTEGETEEEEESDTEENKLSEVRGREAEWDQHASGSRGPVRGREAEAQGETGSLPPSHPNPPQGLRDTVPASCIAPLTCTQPLCPSLS